MFSLLAQRLNSRPVTLQSYRFLRARWERGYLKDLYHRRLLLGADPLLSRSSQPNWNYSAEIAAFTNRIGAVTVDKADVIKALTSSSYKNRADHEAADIDKKSFLNDNSELVQKGKTNILYALRPFLRANMPKAPEDLIEAVVNQITSETVLSNIGMHLGLESLVRTAEHPPSHQTISNSLLSLAAVMSTDHLYKFVMDFIIPQLIDVDFVEVFPLNDPLAVLCDILKKNGAHEVEPRLLRSIGEVSAQPVYVVGIYKDKQEVVGQSAGESVAIAVDMAAREGLLRLWGLTADRLFFFGGEGYTLPLHDFHRENYKLQMMCDPRTDCSLQAISAEDPLNIVEVALKYKNEVESAVGKSYTKRLRHKFSRGSLHKRSHRYLVKPKVYTVA